MTESINLEHIAIILNRPRHSENIGAAARAMKNMGIPKLVIVGSTHCDLSKVLRMATHVAAELVEQIEFFENLKEGLEPYHYVVGTTARLGGMRQGIQTPTAISRNLISLSQTNRIAVLFGPEDKGLSNEDLRFCHALVNIPTYGFSSINLAQAVMIICYEFSVTRSERSEFIPRLASRYELDAMYEQVKDILVRINYIHAENPDYWMNKIRHFFTRIQLRASEVSIIRGICRQINWYEKKCFENGTLHREVHQ
ncbi:MAG: TrmJ/YjtD family RNA methyltransferase [Thermodesulfobacteriota bacterium]